MPVPQTKQTQPAPNEDDVLRRMLSTPHKPHAEKPAPVKRAVPKKTAQK